MSGRGDIGGHESARTAVRRLLLPFLGLLLAFAVPANAAAKIRLDPSYGKKGIAVLAAERTPHRSPREAVAIGPDGGLVIATNRTLQWLGPDGRIDRGFGDDGTVTLDPLPGGSFQITGAAVDPKGRIVVVGTSTPPQPPRSLVETNFIDGEGPPVAAARSDARVLRLLPDGKPDPSFGHNGVVETDFGLPTPEYEGVKLAAAPAIDTSGVTVDSAGRIVVTGGAVAGLASSCYHDDFGASLSDAAFVARLTPSGEPDPSFAKDGVFGGISLAENPLKLEVAGNPLAAPGGGIAFRQGSGPCGRGSGTSPGFIRLGSGGDIRSSGTRLRGRGAAALAVEPDGSMFLLIEPLHYWQENELVEKLRPDGTLDPSFGDGGRVRLRLTKWSQVDRLAVTKEGEVLVGGFYVPEGPRANEGAGASVMLMGLKPDGASDPRFGRNGIAKVRIPCSELGGLWVDSDGRATLTTRYEPKGGLHGLAAARFELGG
jgi:uncharacterized delta-60 repeat protein